MIKQCKLCGAEFEAVGRNAKFCSECKKVRAHERNRKYYIKMNFGADVAESYEAAKKSQAPLKEIVRQADAAGMTYGQYVAKMEGKSSTPQRLRALSTLETSK